MDQNWIDAESQKAKEMADAMDDTSKNILNRRDLERKNKAKRAK